MVSLRWKLEGARPTSPPPEYLEFVKRKRTQLAWLAATTYIASLAVFGLWAYVQEGWNSDIFLSIFSYNSAGLLLGVVLSYMA